MQLGQDMDERDFIAKGKMLEIINDIDQMGVKAVTFSGGGEPLLYKYIVETLRRLSQTKVKFAALTNGSQLKGEIAEILAHNATWIRISMDGWDNESYAKYRGVSKGEFSKLLNNIENFKKLAGDCYLGVSYIIDQRNVHHIYDFTKTINQLGVDSVKMSPCIVSNNGKKNNQYHHKIFNTVKGQINLCKSDFSSDGFEIFDSYHELDEKFSKEYNWCPFIQIMPVIGADLNVYTCHDKAYNLQNGLIGSIKNQSFQEFWISDKNNFFKTNPSKHCNHHCLPNITNKMILEYLNADENHLEFI